MMVYISELEGHVWYLYILEMLVQMSWSWQWWCSTRQSSGSTEKEMKSGRESGWSARFLRVAVSYRGQRSEVFIFRPALRVSVVLLWLAHNVGHMLIKVGCWPAQDAIQQSDRKLFSMDINHSITRGKQSFPTHGSTGSSEKSWSPYFPSSNSINSFVGYRMKRWLKRFAWANLLYVVSSNNFQRSEAGCVLDWRGQASREHYAPGT